MKQTPEGRIFEAEQTLLRAHTELTETKEKLEAIMSAVPVGILVFNQGRQIVSDNPAARKLFGMAEFRPGSLRCGDYIGCCHRHNHAEGCGSTADCPDCEINSALAQVLTGGVDRTEDREKEILQDTKHRQRLWIQFSVSPVVLQGQGYAILVFWDISRQKQVEAELKRSERLLLNSQRIGKIGGWEWDIENQSMVWTDETYRIHGFSPDEFEPGSPEHIARSLACYSPEAREVVVKAFERCVSTGEPYDFEVPFTNTAGRSMWVHTTGQAERKGDRTVKVLGILMDITGLKQAEHALRKANIALQSAVSKARAFAKKADAANRAKSLFISNMSHELRTPLNAVIGFSQLLARDPMLTERQRGDVQVVLRSSQDLLMIINDILEISRIEAGRSETRRVNFSIHELLMDLEGMFRSQCDAKGLRLVMERDDHLQEFLYGDRTKLKQILLNLLSNAVKFTGNGGISLRVCSDVYQEGDTQKKEMVRLTVEVEDSGIGISREDLERIFTPFEQVDSPAQMGGTGLGLAICREYIALLGGNLQVTSEPGRGSCFGFTAVMTKGKADPGNGVTAHLEVAGLAPDTGSVRVLVVDDNTDNQVLVKALLVPAGFEVRQALNGIQAIEMFKEFSPHAVLMDMRMPDMDGYEATRRIKRTDAGLAIPIIALTASAFEQGKRKTLEAGADAYLRKPFQHRELFEVLGQCLELQYVYRQDNGRKHAALTAQDVSALSGELRATLRQAVEKGDMMLFSELLEPMAKSRPDLVRQLRKLADLFDYGRLNALLAGKNLPDDT